MHEPEGRDLSNLVLGAIAAKAFKETAQYQVAVAFEHHVDEVNDDDPTDVAQAKLADDFFSGFQVVAGNGLFQISALAGELAGVDVNHCHRFGVVDYEGPAAGQPHLAIERFGELLVNAVRSKHVFVLRPPAHPIGKIRRDRLDVLLDR